MSRPVSGLLIVFATITFITSGRVPRLVRPNTRDLEAQLALALPEVEAA